MTDRELKDAISLKVFHQGEEREINTGYCGDLLSWVMGRAPAGAAWITVMSNSNVAAVALLRDVSCVILSQGVEPDETLLKRMTEEDISLYGIGDDTYTAAVKISNLI